MQKGRVQKAAELVVQVGALISGQPTVPIAEWQQGAIQSSAHNSTPDYPSDENRNTQG